MVHAGMGSALDTPRTNIGDATYLKPDFADISQEATFISPTKPDLLQQLRNGKQKGATIGTPRNRGPLADRQNIPQNVGAGEFTPLLKASTTRSAMKKFGKENGAAVSATPALRRIEEDDMVPVPQMDASMYSASRDRSYADMPQIESSSVASTPLAMPQRRDNGKGPFNDGKGQSLREQEELVENLNKANFQLKLKIHFLEEAMKNNDPDRKAAAIQENALLKANKAVMQQDLKAAKKQVTRVEREMENCRLRLVELQEQNKQAYADEAARDEIDQMRQTLEDRDAEVEHLERRLKDAPDDEELEKLRDDVGDLEADLREKDRLLGEREDELDDLRQQVRTSDGKDDELEDLRQQLQDRETEIEDLERRLKDAPGDEQVEKLKDDVGDLEADLREKDRVLSERDDELDDLRQQLQDREGELEDLERRLGENPGKDEIAKLQDEIEDLKADLAEKDRLLETRDDDLDDARQKLEADLREKSRSLRQREEELEDLRQQLEDRDGELEDLERRLEAKPSADEITRLQNETEDLKSDLAEKDRLLASREDDMDHVVQKLETDLQEKSRALSQKEDDLEDLRQKLDDREADFQDVERRLESNSGKEQLAKLQDDIEDLEADVREKERLLNTRDDDLDEIRQQLEHRDRDVQDLQGRLKESEEELAHATEKASKKFKSEEDRLLTTRNDDLERTRRKLERREKEIEELKDRLKDSDEADQVRWKLERRDREVEDLKERLKETEDQLVSATEKARKKRQEDDKRAQTSKSEDVERVYRKLERRDREVEDLRTRLNESREELARAAEKIKTKQRQPEEPHTALVLRAQQKLDRRDIEVEELKSRLRQSEDQLARAAELAKKKHKDELQGALVQMQWQQACLSRETKFHHDLVHTKHFLEQQLDLAYACNKVQLAENQKILATLRDYEPWHLALMQGTSKSKSSKPGRPTLKSFITMARFIARTRISARKWAGSMDKVSKQDKGGRSQQRAIMPSTSRRSSGRDVPAAREVPTGKEVITKPTRRSRGRLN